jgi:hypothetical protein
MRSTSYHLELSSNSTRHCFTTATSEGDTLITQCLADGSAEECHFCALLGHWTYNLSHTVDFATVIQNKSSTAIDNIFVDNSRLKSSYTSPLINGLSDHDAQFLTINNFYAARNKIPLKQRTTLINGDTLTNFQTLLKQETWESVYQSQDVNCMFDSFVSTFLNISEASFPVNIKVQTTKRMTRSRKE